MATGKDKRYFDREFKYEAIRLMNEGKRSVRDIAKDLDIHPNVLHQWRRKYRVDMEHAFPGKGHMKPPEEEIRRLQRENEELREEKDIFKKSVGHLLKAPKVRYEFINRHRSEFAVMKMCRVLEVSRSGYYSWCRHEGSIRQRENDRLLVHIRQAYVIGRGTYGSPRVTAELRANGVACGRNRVARLMRQNGIKAKTKRRFKATTKSRHDLLLAENLLNGMVAADASDKIWVSDITFIWTREGWMYLAAILDAFNRQIVGWSMGDRLNHGIIVDALEKAFRRRKPGAGLIFHSDRGTQYASYVFRDLLDGYGFVPSMSSKSHCYDNALMESFFHTLKTELIYFEKYRTRQEARGSVFEYIEIFYNRIRRHSSLDYCSPVEFEKRMGEA
ncbi:MAG: IS3 family transposase [Thermodesulfobacteriota bacterium]